jgi:hypothetical protein
MSAAFYVAELRGEMAAAELNWSRIWALMIMWPGDDAEPGRGWAYGYIASEAVRRNVVEAMLKTWRAHMVDRLAAIDGAAPAEAGAMAFEVDSGMMVIETQLSSHGGPSNGSDRLIMNMDLTGADQNPIVRVQRPSDPRGFEFDGVNRLRLVVTGRMEQLALATTLELTAHYLREKWNHQEPASELLTSSEWLEREARLAEPEPDEGDE